jgi:voltage-gated potassium channel
MAKEKFTMTGDGVRFWRALNPLKRLIPPGIILVIIITIGLFGYTQVEKWPLLDSVYMLVITLSTVGYREVHELSPFGKVLTMFLILGGVSTAIYAAGSAVEMIVEGELLGYRGRKRMEKKIKEMRDHYIICGFGRVGLQVAAEFEKAKIPYVVIDSKRETAAELEPKGIPYLIGDITQDSNLEEAGIRSAKGLIASADSDTANVYVTLSARVLNPHLFIVARAGNVDSEEKLKKAGANKVISPYFTAGLHMAETAIKHKAESKE